MLALAGALVAFKFFERILQLAIELTARPPPHGCDIRCSGQCKNDRRVP
jgi:hypothetical protein